MRAPHTRKCRRSFFLRRDWTEEKLLNYFDGKDPYLTKLYEESTIPYEPDEQKIKTLLLSCLEHHYGSLDKCIVVPDAATLALEQIQAILDGLR